ncbi:MAG TPA: VCBS repeat-containing protein, partial [Planctomycetota bacterium]|nr:VCBS repeat-containing protein [Planctomycetota bacterium]
KFTEVTASTGIAVEPASGARRVVPLDVDGHNDVDLLVVGASSSSLFRNKRGFLFEKSATLPGAIDGAAGDLDGDGLPDVVLAGPQGLVVARSLGPTVEAPKTIRPGPLEEPRVALLDLENRGQLDVVTFAKDTVSVLRRNASGAFEDVASALFPRGFSGVPTSIAALDLDGDFDLDLVVARREGPAVIERNVGGERDPALAFTFRGTKTNRAGIGTRIEVRSAGLRIHREVWSVPAWIGIGPRPLADGVFLKWTNGIDEAEGLVPAGRYLYSLERRGREGSCPFVYSWNGREFTFVTDAIGATPLGLYAAPGMWVPPQSREWLRIRSDQLTPRDGVYEIRFTEEMRELTYLDRVRLLCVDHPAGTSVYPDERFCFPPVPPKRLLLVRKEVPIASARDGAGRDVTELLAREDRRSVGPPTRLGWQGMSEEHSLELDLGDAANAPSLRLFLTGYFAWTNSSINRAIADAGIRFQPPRVDVRAADGSWRTIVEDAGFPAGMQKTLPIDLSDKLKPGERVIRLVTNLDLHWDRAFLSVDDAPFETRTTELAAATADLRDAGVARWRPVIDGGPTEPKYDDRIRAHVYDLHVGDYTRYGDVRELLDAADDRFAIFHHGDEIALAFRVSDAPPISDGWTRTFLLDSSGWAKDADPNTFAYDTVEPLPFQKMSGYPYGAEERYPDDEQHVRYRREWNTRRVTQPRPVPVTAGIEAIHAR